MNIFVQFPEAYLDFVARLYAEIKAAHPGPLEIYGISIRRKTVCRKVDALAGELGIVECEWWSAVEQRIIAGSYDPQRLQYYRSVFSDRQLRHLISCDREVGFGYVTGGSYARTPLRKFVESSDENRWKYIVGVLDYFLERFATLKPAFIFLNEVTFTWELAASMVAEHLQIPCLILCYTRAGQKFTLTDNPFQRCPDIERLYRQALSQPELVAAHTGEARQLLETFRSRPELPDYSERELKKMVRQASVWGMLKQLAVDLMKVAALGLKLFGTRGCMRQEFWWDVLCRNVNAFIVARKALKGKLFERTNDLIDADYIYYPLHLEPESATLILSEPFTNQLAFIEQISKNMPAGYKLLVKEHIPAMGFRPPGFYDRIKALPDVHLLSPFEDGFSLIRKARLICVLAGTVGWEALMQQKPLIVVGNAQYMGINEGFVRCENLFLLDAYIKEAMKTDPVPDERLVLFIAATMQRQCDIRMKDVLYWHYGLDPGEVISKTGVEQLAQQILDRIN